MPCPSVLSQPYPTRFSVWDSGYRICGICLDLFLQKLLIQQESNRDSDKLIQSLLLLNCLFFLLLISSQKNKKESIKSLTNKGSCVVGSYIDRDAKYWP